MGLLKRFDLIILGSIFVLTILLSILWGLGDHTVLQVSQFSWEGRQISAGDRYFRLTFNRPVKPESIANSLTIDPPLPGKLSWSGKQFFYTLSDLPIYGQDYQVKIADPQPLESSQKKVEPFLSRFQTRDRIFAYIGTEKDERGRLIFYNLTKQQKSLLTPADLIVLNFSFYPNGDRILFSGIPRNANPNPKEQQLYSITTGFNPQNQDRAPAAGQVRPILSNKDYQNGAFQLAANGNTIIVQRTNRKNPLDQSLWVIDAKGKARSLGIMSDDFLLSPDAQELAVTQNDELSILPLGPGAIANEQEFTKVLAFAKKTAQKIVLKNHQGGGNTLYILDAQNQSQELLTTKSPIIDCLLEPRQEKLLYCLKIDLSQQSNQYKEEPFLSAIDLQTKEETPLLALPNYRDVRLSVAADGLALLFDQVVTIESLQQADLFTDNGQSVEGGRLWLLALPEVMTKKEIQPVPPEALLPGYKPQWMP